MASVRTRQLTRQQIGEFVGTQRGIRAFEDVQADIVDQNDAVSTASFLVLGDQPSLGAERVFTPSSNFVVTDNGANATLDIDLSDTGVGAGAYGSASELVTITVDAKGRVTGVINITLNTDSIAEGAGNLFYTDARARLALSVGTNLTYDNTTGVFDLASSIDVPGLVRCDSFRIDAAPSASAATTTHKLAISLNGTTYYLLLSNV